jgi:hypothetical protein
MTADGQGQTRITEGANAAQPCWAPERSRIAFLAAQDGVRDVMIRFLE